jgi:hypothetical protein
MQFADAIKKKPSSELNALVEALKKEIKELENTIKRLEFKNIVLQDLRVASSQKTLYIVFQVLYIPYIWCRIRQNSTKIQ